MSFFRCRKVSAVSGDARRALDICRRAMEIAESRNAETISLQDVTEAVSEMIASPKVQAIKYCSKMEQVFLQAISAEVTRTSIEEVYFKDAYKQFEALCSFDGTRLFRLLTFEEIRKYFCLLTDTFHFMLQA